jgi:hypothetical protein
MTPQAGHHHHRNHQEDTAMTRTITFQGITRPVTMRAFAFALAMTIAATVHAEGLGTALLASADSGQRLCIMTNVGTTPVTVSWARLINLHGDDVTTYSNCDVLAPGGSCGFGTIGAASVDWARAVVELAGRNVARQIRGQCQVMDASNRILWSQELR